MIDIKKVFDMMRTLAMINESEQDHQSALNRYMGLASSIEYDPDDFSIEHVPIFFDNLHKLATKRKVTNPLSSVLDQHEQDLVQSLYDLDHLGPEHATERAYARDQKEYDLLTLRHLTGLLHDKDVHERVTPVEEQRTPEYLHALVHYQKLMGN